ncbi:spore germination protein GerPC [Halobacillus salinarum]|uniref:Spore germination protein GerPC n=1 Tax=Halobacillus salinarum TaxID=2932257 RepID=A0ABY4EG99_9BACI|nr:spore germination protein GerPC [Halobacillus salinarum]UOQ43477.1 spore germination protein GerPC [Halobacillus salinarum]
MSYYQPWQAWFQQMMQYMQKQQEMIDQLTDKVEQLQSNEKPQTVIEKIEYHFDQLKIETLEGTLQIGLTPNGSDYSELGELYSNNHTAQAPIQHTLQDYMTTDIPQWMDRYVKDHDVSISDTHKEQIINDVRKQLPQRVQHYQQEYPDLDETTMLHRIQEEVRHSLGQYLNSYEGDGK